MLDRHLKQFIRPFRPPSPATDWHGTNSGYNNYHCRCDPCLAAHAAYYREWRARNAHA